MRNKKGFTLIELLAIIVILAIIAVITTPIVLNVIENAKKGAAIDSALGYKDAVHKYYASRLSVDSNFKMVDSTYEIDSNGYLSDGTNAYEVQVSGKIPSNGYVQIENSKVINACIGFDEYAVSFVGGNVTEVSKGTCDEVDIVSAVDAFAGEVYDFNYVTTENKEQIFNVPNTGYYRLEVWGAQGGDSTDGNIGGYGGYSSGYVYLTAGTDIFINVGGRGSNNGYGSVDGGYNGGGAGQGGYCNGNSPRMGASGGGATHIALSSGTLASFDADEDGVADSEEVGDILIVAGGGGGGFDYGGNGKGGHGGGYIGGTATYNLTAYGHSVVQYATGGTQTSGGRRGNSYWENNSTGGTFGQGDNKITAVCDEGSGGGGGFYGGAYSWFAPGSGGSGYIGNERLINGIMYCYDCPASSSDGIITSPIRKVSSDAISYTAKSEDGHARLTFIGSSLDNLVTKLELAFGPTSFSREYVIPKTGYYKMEVWGASGASVTHRGITNTPGYGGYSTGSIYLTRGTHIFINVGGEGISNYGSSGTSVAGGYNGGGSHTSDSWGVGASGGGATHIALVDGELYQLGDYKGEFDSNAGVYRSSDILIVAGGGGSGGVENSYRVADGGHGGGYAGGNGTLYNDSTPAVGVGGTQSTGSAFGGNVASSGWCGSEGGGFFGGTLGAGGGGGSGYIGNSSLVNKSMYCYGCNESDGVDTMTVSTIGDSKDTVNCPNGYSSEPISRCAKLGAGYAKISYLGKTLN